MDAIACSNRYTVPLVFIVTFFSAALASISGIATCYVPVLNTTVPGNYTPNQAAFGVGLFWARAGAGPLGFLVFATSVCVYFGKWKALRSSQERMCRH